MPDVKIEQQTMLDVLGKGEPALSATSDVPVIETKPDAAAPEKAEPPVESAPTETPVDATAEPEKKKSQGVQKRIDELTREREDAKRLAEAEKAEKLRLLALLEQGKQQSKEAIPDDGPVRPQRDAYDNPEAYDDALATYAEQRAEWSAKRQVEATLAEERRKAQESEVLRQQETIQATYKERVGKAQEKYPDYQAVAESPDVSVSIPMAHAIIHSEHGPDIAYFLGKNPTEAKRISALAPPLQLLELGKIEAKLVEAPKQISSAPKPVTPLRSSADASVSAEEETMEQYHARRTKELQAERRPGRSLN